MMIPLLLILMFGFEDTMVALDDFSKALDLLSVD